MNGNYRNLMQQPEGLKRNALSFPKISLFQYGNKKASKLLGFRGFYVFRLKSISTLHISQ